MTTPRRASRLPGAMSRVAVHRLLRPAQSSYAPGRLYIVEHNGELHATDSYWLAPLSLVPGVSELLAYWNLEGVGMYDVGTRVTKNRTDGLPSVASLFPTGRTEVLTPRRMNNAILHVPTHSTSDKWCAVYDSESLGPVFIQRSYLELLAGSGWDLAELRQEKPLGPVVVNDRSLVMPVRMP